MPLYIGKSHSRNAPVQSIFRLVGNDEDALTHALGFLLAHDHSLCAKLVRYLKVAYRRPLKTDYSVHLQEVTGPGFGRRDIVIVDDRIRIVLEAKVGRAEPTSQQLIKYAAEDRLWNKYATRAVVTLTQVKLTKATGDQVEAELSKQGIQWGSVQWHEIVDLVLGHRPSDDSEVSRYLFNQFTRYVRRDFRMGYYDAEIHIQDVNRDNAKVFNKGWMYVTSLSDKRSPLYFAPYFTRQNPREGISEISRVIDYEIAVLDKKQDIGVEPPSERHRQTWKTGLKKLRERAEKEGFGHGQVRLLHLDEPLTICNPPLTKKDLSNLGVTNGTLTQIPKGFSLRFDELLPHVRS